jgi:hypothetical protein
MSDGNGEVTFEEGEVIIGNRQRVGFTGEDNVCAMFLTDGPDPTAVINSNKDVYITAGELIQIDSKTLKHNVTVECTEIYKKMNHTVNTDKTSKIIGKYSLEIDDKHTVLAKSGQKITVLKGQTIDVLSGDRNLTVGSGNLNETILGDKTTFIKGKNTVTVVSDSMWVKTGSFTGLNMSKEEQLKLSTSVMLSIGAKSEASIAAAEILNVGGSFEQTIALKRIFNASIVKEETVGIKMGENKTINLQKDGAMTKEKRNVVDSAATFVKAESKLWKLGAKLAMFD